MDNIKVNSSIPTDMFNLMRDQFKNDPNIKVLIDTITEMKQRVHESIIGYAIGTILDNAKGIHLDEIGNILGLSRSDESDEDFRKLLKVRVARRVSEGTRPDIFRVIEFAKGDLVGVSIVYNGNKDVTLTIPSGIPPRIVEEIKLAFPVLTNLTVVEV